MKLGQVASSGVIVVVGLAILYLAVTGGLDKLDAAIRNGWAAAKGSWGAAMLNPNPATKRPATTPTPNVGAGRFTWPLSLS